jgi:YbbR domain-containing protein
MNEGLEFALAGILSVLIVTGIWFSITRGQDILETFDVPVEYVNRTPQLEIMDTSATSVQLRLSGSRSIIGSIRPDQLRVMVDLSQAVEGANNIPINSDNLTLPPGIILNDVNPHIIEVAMDVLAEKEIPVQADWVGKLNPALILTEVTVTPEKINFIGGKNLLDSIRTIYTEKIPVDRITQSEEITVTLDFNPAKLKISSKDKSKVTVRYNVMNRLPP